MDDPTDGSESALDSVGPGEPTSGPPDDDPLAQFDTIVAEVAQRDRQLAEQDHEEHEAMQRFLAEFQAVCESEVRPAMEAVLKRLRDHGGGGVIEEHPGGEARFRRPSLFLWMSLQGDIVGEPRADREPYLQLEADVERRVIEVSEGDMWRGVGGKRSGRIGTWQISYLTREHIIDELLAIARRAAHLT